MRSKALLRPLLTLLACGALAACDPTPPGSFDGGALPDPDAAVASPDAQPLPGADASAVLDASLPDASVGSADAAPQPPDASSSAADATTPAGPDAGHPGLDAGGPVSTTPVRVMAANLTSGPTSTYDSGEGLRLIQGVMPDVVLLQEFFYGDDTDAAFQGMVDSTLGVGFSFCREVQQANPFGATFIPSGILSRWPILECGSWDDPQTDSRGFAYARIDLPGPRDLWAVSLHLMTKDNPTRRAEAVSLVAAIQAHVPSADLLVLGGDLNTDDLVEGCFTVLSAIVDVGAPRPVDQNGNGDTNTTRVKPYDHVLAGPSLRSTQVPTLVGASVYPAGLVLDSRVYTPLYEIDPVQETDSGALNMQHMGVVKDFLVPN